MRFSFNPNICSGLLFIGVALFFGVTALGYRIGTMAAIGAGFFPLMLSILLGVMGLSLIVSGRGVREVVTETASPRVVLLILGAVVLFAVCLNYLGLMAAIVLQSVMASLAYRRFTMRAAVAGALFVGGLCYLIFKVFLNLPVKFWPGF